MSFQKFKEDSYCVGGRHWTATKDIYGDITSEGSEKLIDYCSSCNLRKSLTVSDNTILEKCLGGFFKNLGIRGLIVPKKMAKNVLKNPGRALDLGANVDSAVASRNPKAALSTLTEVFNIYRTASGSYLGTYV